MTVTPAEHPLPANPNAVSFAADAQEVLQGRSWADVQRMAERCSRSFHEASGLACLVGLGWRVALDRRNQRQRQVTVYFVFDGPATAQHLDLLDAAMELEGPTFTAGSIERVPANGVPVLLWADRVPFLVLERGGNGGLSLRRLAWVDGQVRPLHVRLDQADGRVRAPELDAVVGVLPPYGDAEREVERMRLAFALHYATAIVEADGVIRSSEEDFMTSVFPDTLIERLGLEDPGARAEYLEAARRDLAGRLGHHDKLGLIGLFFSACYADGSLDAREMRVLRDAGEQLGLTRDQVVKYLRRFW